MNSTVLTDPFGRSIDYVRISVTDRCDFRCTYCMAEDMTFLPRSQLLTLEELAFIAKTFVELGTTRIRITGGEPLIRQDITTLLSEISKNRSLKDLSITTNGSRLNALAGQLKQCGVTRINVSLDTLKPERFSRITRIGNLQTVLEGINTAINVGFEKIKINTVALRKQNGDELAELVAYAVNNAIDISFIEEMPLGQTTAHNRREEFLPSDEIISTLQKSFTLAKSNFTTGGPSRYWQVAGTQTKIGFISPHSNNFCSTCNRVRLTADGRLLLCLGNEHSADLRHVVRQYPNDKQALTEAIQIAASLKPEKHHFDLNEPVKILRFMNATGG